MRLYSSQIAPNPRRVRVFLAEKGISVPIVEIDMRAGEQLQPAFRQINPEGTVPVLELDNGVRIDDSFAICAYFEALQPEPSLIGRSAEEKGVILSWQRRTEREGLYAAMEGLRNFARSFKGRSLTGADSYEQIPALAERGRTRVQRLFERVEKRLGGSEWIAGDRFSIADITMMVTVDFARLIKLDIPESATNLSRWFTTVSARPSAKA
jgi:glutathione S-transferase